MIEIYEGRLGGGKTYSAVVRMVDHLRQGGLVCTNVEIIWTAVKAYVASRFDLQLEDDQIIQLTDEQIGLFHRHTPSGVSGMPVLVVIDEAHLNFNSRDWAQSSRELLAFLTQSRKVHTDVIFISQSMLNMDKQFARLIQYVWRFRDLEKWKIPGLGIPWPMKQILCCQYDYDGITQLQRTFIFKDPKVFGLYNTNSLLRVFPRLDGQKAKRKLEKAKVKKSMAKYLIPIAIVIGIIAAYILKKDMQEIGGSKKEVSSQVIPASIPIPTRPLSVQNDKSKTHQDDALKAAYDIYDETFKSYNGYDKSLTTDKGWYQVGEMSNRGFVIAVSDRRARVQQPDGRSGWVVANDRPTVAIVTTKDKPEQTPPPAFRTGSSQSGIPEGHSSPAGERLLLENSGQMPKAEPSGVPLSSGTSYPPTRAMEIRKSSRGIPLDKLSNLPKQVQ